MLTALTACPALAAGNPSGNRQLSVSTLSACELDSSGSSCVSSALGDINAARASEGVSAMVLPPNFVSLTVQQQLLVVSDLERTARGLVPILGLAAPYNAVAQQGAEQEQDPSPNSTNGDAWGSNWAGGYPSTLEADFGWMYDDGPGSDNVDCPAPGAAGCWGHRDNVVGPWHAPLVMGAGYVANGSIGASMSELFVGGDHATAPGQADAPLTPPGYAGYSGASSSPAPRQTALRVGGPRLARGQVTFVVVLTRGQGSIRVSATRGRRVIQMRVTRRGSRFTISGKLARGTWTVRVVLVPSAGWGGRTYVFTLRVR